MGNTYKSKGKPRNYQLNNKNPDSSLPHSVEDYLQNGASEGERNARLFHAAGQCRDIGMPEDAVVALLSGRANQDGLKDGEISTTVGSAFRGPKREPAKSASTSNGSRHGDNTGTKGTGSNGEYFSQKRGKFSGIGDTGRNHGKEKSGVGSSENPMDRAQPVELPEPFEEGFRAILMTAFEEGEGVCVGGTFENEDGEYKPEIGVTLPRERWLELLDGAGGKYTKLMSSKHGHFLRVNPMRIDPKGNSRNTNEDVTDYRHVLVEFDTDASGNTIPKERQMGAFLASGLPITAVLDSGNKSLHAWVRVDAADKAEYEERVLEVYSLFGSEEFDTQNHNPNRYSRCPDGLRLLTDGPRKGELVTQTLVKINVGADSWKDWERKNAVANFGRHLTAEYLRNYDVKNDPNNMIGDRWLCKGGSVVFVSQSGCGKSAMLMQFMQGFANARTDMTFGITPIRPLKQLTVQAENDDGDLSEEFQSCEEAFDLSDEERNRNNENLDWQTVSSVAGMEFLRKLELLILDYKPDICWIDPLMSYIGNDLSKAEVVSEFCVEGLNAIAARTGVIFGLIHHMGKPKDAQMRAGMTASDLAYLGFGSSNLTNWAREVMVLNRIQTANPEDPDTFTLTCTKRRKRAGMRVMPRDGETTERIKTAEIFVCHSTDGRIYWSQCPEPDRPDDRKKKSGGVGDGKHKKPVGRPSTIAPRQRAEIVLTWINNGGKLSAKEKSAFADRFRKTSRAIADYVKKVEEISGTQGISEMEAMLQDTGLKKEDL